MNTAALSTEFAKSKRLRSGLIAVTLALAVTGLTVVSAATSPAFASAQGSWGALLAGLGLAFPICSPLLLAVLASRQVEIEHQSNGWLFAQTSGISPGALCRLKLLTTGAGAVTATAAASSMVLVFGLITGDASSLPWGLWVGYTLSIIVVNLAVLALHILLASQVQNQLVGLGIGVLGTLIGVFASAMPASIAHLTPWGYYALSTAAEYQGEDLVLTQPSHLSVAALAVVAAGAFGAVTTFFDHKET